MWRIVWRVFGACFGVKQRSLPLSGKKEGLVLLADSEGLLVGRDSHLVHEKNSMFDTLLRHCQAQAGVSKLYELKIPFHEAIFICHSKLIRSRFLDPI